MVTLIYTTEKLLLFLVIYIQFSNNEVLCGKEISVMVWVSGVYSQCHGLRLWGEPLSLHLLSTPGDNLMADQTLRPMHTTSLHHVIC